MSEQDDENEQRLASLLPTQQQSSEDGDPQQQWLLGPNPDAKPALSETGGLRGDTSKVKLDSAQQIQAKQETRPSTRGQSTIVVTGAPFLRSRESSPVSIGQDARNESSTDPSLRLAVRSAGTNVNRHSSVTVNEETPENQSLSNSPQKNAEHIRESSELIERHGGPPDSGAINLKLQQDSAVYSSRVASSREFSDMRRESQSKAVENKPEIGDQQPVMELISAEDRYDSSTENAKVQLAQTEIPLKNDSTREKVRVVPQMSKHLSAPRQKDLGSSSQVTIKKSLSKRFEASQHQFQPGSQSYHRLGTTDSQGITAQTMMFEWQPFLAELEIKENEMLVRQIKSCPFSIADQADEKGFNLIHHAVLKCISGKVQTVIDLLKEIQGASDDVIKVMVNAKTNHDQFTPLHLASFKGNMNAVRTLMDHGADPYALNFFGLNMIHVAAQGDSAASLYHFYKLNVDINFQDKRGSTPLHWACYSNSEIALSYLLAWGPELNLQDQDGFTPLHLAVKSVDAVESTRPVRFLLIRGAQKNIRDNAGNTPLDLVNRGDVKSESLANDLRKLLGPSGLLECLIISPPTKKIQRQPATMIFYFTFISICYTIEFLFVFPYLSDWAVWLNVGFKASCLVFFTLSSCVRPGYLRNTSVEFHQMLDTIDSTQLCPDCETIRTSRSRHCSVCGHCIERFDHHCPWINNCVGVKNHNYFLLYVFSQALVVYTAFGQGIVALEKCLTQHNPYYRTGLIQFDLLEKESFMLPFQVLLLCITGFFSLPMSLLLFVQCLNFKKGKTTMERFSRSAHDDQQTRILNSGIRNDAQIFRHSTSRVHSAPQSMESFDSLIEQSMDRENRLISTEIENNPNSSMDRVAAANYRQMRKRNRRFTSEANRQNTCWAMCCQHDIRDQAEIFEEHLITTRKPPRKKRKDTDYDEDQGV